MIGGSLGYGGNGAFTPESQWGGGLPQGYQNPYGGGGQYPYGTTGVMPPPPSMPGMDYGAMGQAGGVSGSNPYGTTGNMPPPPAMPGLGTPGSGTSQGYAPHGSPPNTISPNGQAIAYGSPMGGSQLGGDPRLAALANRPAGQMAADGRMRYGRLERGADGNMQWQMPSAQQLAFQRMPGQGSGLQQFARQYGMPGAGNAAWGHPYGMSFGGSAFPMQQRYGAQRAPWGGGFMRQGMPGAYGHSGQQGTY